MARLSHSRSLSYVAAVFLLVAAVFLDASHQQLAAAGSFGPTDVANITAIFECDKNCTESSCTKASVPQNVCFFVPPALSYVVYQCQNNGTQVQLKAYGPLKFLCNSDNPIHETFEYPTHSCVLPKAGGYTEYLDCPTD